MIKIFIPLVLYALVFASSEIAYRKLHCSFLFSRKMSHIAGSLISFFLPLFMTNIGAIATGLIFTLVLIFSKYKYMFKGIHDKNGAGLGEVVFPLGLAISACFIWPFSVFAYQGSCLVLGLSDGFAGYIGSAYGKRNFSVIGGSKTVEGSVIFFIFTFIIFCAYYFLYATQISILGVVPLFLYATLVTLVEAIFSGGWDNLIIPITAGLALLLIIS